MSTLNTELTDVIYNAASGMFEARVTVHERDIQHSYPCAVHGAIDLPFDRAARALAAQALRRHGRSGEMRSTRLKSVASTPLRALRTRLRRGLPLGQYGFFRGRAA